MVPGPDCYARPMQTSTRSATVIGAGYVGLVTAVGLAGLGRRPPRRDAPGPIGRPRGRPVPIHEAGLQEALRRGRGGRSPAVHEARRTDRASSWSASARRSATTAGATFASSTRRWPSSRRSARARTTSLVIRSTLPVGGTRRAVRGGGLPTRARLHQPGIPAPGHRARGLPPSDPRRHRPLPRRRPDALDDVAGPLRRRSARPASSSTSRRPRSSRTAPTPSSRSSCRSPTRSPALCEEAGADVDEVLAGIGADPRIGRTYMHPGFGFGGSCLPKELTTLAVAGRTLGLPMHVTTAASAANLAAQDRFAERVAERGRRARRAGPSASSGSPSRPAPTTSATRRRSASPRRLLEGGATVRGLRPGGRRQRRGRSCPRSRSWTSPRMCASARMPWSSPPSGRSSATCRGTAGSTDVGAARHRRPAAARCGLRCGRRAGRHPARRRASRERLTLTTAPGAAS